jgi:N-methylhydantoinase B/oxoprolinase/acetone carboxylase alpha subunit
MGEQGRSTVSKSLQQHGEAEIYKQLRLRMKNSGLDTIKVEVTRRAGKFRFNFTGSAEQVTQAEQILAAWP